MFTVITNKQSEGLINTMCLKAKCLVFARCLQTGIEPEVTYGRAGNRPIGEKEVLILK